MNRLTRLSLSVLGLVALAGSPLPLSAADDRAAKLAERYEQMVLRRPRLGPSLEKMIQLKGEAGTFEAWVERLLASDDPKEALLLGMVRYRQGRLELAAEALEKASEGDEADWYARFLRGRVAVLQREYEGAEKAFSTAAERVQRPEDLLQVLQALGRCQLRLGHTEAARATWKWVIQLDPDDVLLLEEVAAILADEGAFEDALELVEKLRDREGQSAYQRMKYELRRAEVLARMDRQDDAVEAWRSILARVEEDSWFHQEALGRIEADFRSNRDLEGLAAFYREAIEDRPAAVGLRLALADLLTEQDQQEEALASLQDFLERAPGHVGLRRRIAHLLADTGQFQEAVALFEVLIREQSRDPELPQALGELYAARMGDDPAAREGAMRWLKQVAFVDPDSLPYAIQSAELLRGYGLTEAALDQLDEALARAPDVLDTHRSKGELLLQLDRRAEALETFRAMAAEPRRTAATLLQLAEALRSNGFPEEALAAGREAMGLAPEAFEPAFLVLGLLRDQETWKEVHTLAADLAPRAPNRYFREQVIDLEISALEKQGTLQAVYAETREQPTEDPDLRLRLARMALALQRNAEARDWIEQALQGPPTVERLEVAERLYRELGQPWARIELLEQLMEQSPAVQSDSARRLVGLYERVGEPEKALQTARRVARALPGNREAVQLYTEVLQRQGRGDDALQTLERAARVNDDDLVLLGRLAELYRKQRKRDEAIAAYWKLFRDTEDGQARLAFVRPLYELYAEEEGYEAFAVRLREETRTEQDSSLRPLALSWALQLEGRLDLARDELKKVLAVKADDLRALKRLVDLARAEGAVREAIRFQQQVVEREPSAPHTRLLADLHYEAGDEDKARSLWRETVDRVVVTDSNRSSRYFDWVNTLILRGMMDEAVKAVQDVEQRFQDNWAVTYRAARAYAILNRPDLATPLFQRLLDWPQDLAGTGEPVEARVAPPSSALSVGLVPTVPRMFANRRSPPASFPGVSWSFHGTDLPPDFELPQQIQFIRTAVVNPGRGYGSYQVWRPANLTEMRIATLAFLDHLALTYEPAATWRSEWLDAHDGQPLGQVFAYMRNDLPRLDAGLADWQQAEADDHRIAWLCLAARLGQLQQDPSEGHAAAFNALLESLRKRLSGFAYPIDVLAWTGMQQVGEKAEQEAMARRLGGHDAMSETARSRFVQQLLKSGQRELALDQARQMAEAVAAVPEGPVDPALLLRLRSAIDLHLRLQDLDGALSLFEVFVQRHEGVSRSVLRGELLRPQWMTAHQRNNFPGPNPWCDMSLLQVVRNLQTHTGRAGRGELFMDRLRSLTEESDPPSVALASALASAYSWGDQNEEASTWLGKAVEGSEYDVALVRQQIVLLRKLDRHAEALALLDRIRPGTDFPPKEYYVLRLQLAGLADQEEAGRSAASRLLYMRLDRREQQDLVNRLRNYGMTDEANEVEERAAREAEQRLLGSGLVLGAGAGRSLNLHQEVQYMEQFQRKGQVARARNAAMRLLDLSLTPAAWERQGFVRQRSWQMLTSTEGGTGPYLTRCAEQLERSPESVTLLKRNALARLLAKEADPARSAADRLRALRPGDMRHQAEVGVVYSLLAEWTAAQAQFDRVLESRPGVLFGDRGMMQALAQVTRELKHDETLAARLRDIGYHRLVQRTGVGLLPGMTSQSGISNLEFFASRGVAGNTPLPHAALAVSDLMEEGLAPVMRANYVPRIARIRLKAYGLLDRPEDEFALFSSLVLPADVLKELGVDLPAIASGYVLQEIRSSRNRVSTELDQYMALVKEQGKTDALRQAFERASSRAALDEWGHLVRIHLLLTSLDPETVEADPARLPDLSPLMSEQSGLLGQGTPGGSRVPSHIAWALFASLANEHGRLGAPEGGVQLLEYAYDQFAQAPQSHIHQQLAEQLLRLYDQAGGGDRAITFLTTKYAVGSGQPAAVPGAVSRSERDQLRRLDWTLEKLIQRKAYPESARLARSILDGISAQQNHHYLSNIQNRFGAMARALEGDARAREAVQQEIGTWQGEVRHPMLVAWVKTVATPAEEPAPTPVPKTAP